jgi:hypothetical protein
LCKSSNSHFAFLGIFMLRQFDSVFGCFLDSAAMIQTAGGDFEQVDSDAARDVCPSAGQADG